MNVWLGNEWVPTPGATYKILQFLSKSQYIRETTDKVRPTDKRKRTYEITATGREKVKEFVAYTSMLVKFISICCPNRCLGDL
ncbi:MAG: PadR family transcriptional regulator [Candidatus Heimdallarchaeaceae archaeon]